MKKFFAVALILFVFIVPAMMLLGGCGKSPTTPAVNTSTATWTDTPGNTSTNSPTATITATYTMTNTPVDTATVTVTSTETDTPTPSMTETSTPTSTATGTATPTATPTSTPAPGSVVGNLLLPSSQSGFTYQVLVDNDINYANGVVNMTVGTCPAATTIPYSMTVSAGTYYVYAVIKSASAPTMPPIAGDYLGVNGATYPAYPASANVVVNWGMTTGGTDINMILAANNVYGTMTMPANSNGMNILIALDDDGNVSNGGIVTLEIKQISGMTGTTYNYSTLCFVPGSFYIFAMVDNDASGLPGAPTTGDYLSFTPTGPVTIDPAMMNGPHNLTLTTMP